MKFRVWALAVLMSASMAWAQDLPKFDAPMPGRTQILAMKYSGFTDWASKHAATANEAQQDQLAGYYARIRTAANRPLLQGKPQLVAAMKALNTWNDDYYTALYLHMGGGTLYTHSENRSVAELADVEAAAAEAWNVHPKLHLDVSVVKSFRAHQTGPLPDYVQDKAAYQKALDKEAASLKRLQAAVNQLPVGAANKLIKYINDLANQKWGEQ